MPFTLLHMGPGLAVKGFGGRYFSVLVFGIAQVAMDIEPLIGIIRDADVLHGWSLARVCREIIGVFMTHPEERNAFQAIRHCVFA